MLDDVTAAQGNDYIGSIVPAICTTSHAPTRYSPAMRMNKLLEIDYRNRRALVEAGCVNAWITALLDRETKRVLQEHEVVG